MKKISKALVRRKAQKPTEATEFADGVPRITNDTIAAHREEVLSGARKYIYPLQHSKHRIIMISVGVLIAVVLGFLTYCVVSLYRAQSSSAFLYRVTQVLPFPVARSGGDFIAYENYLFELRHYIHYYEKQQKLSFDSESGQQQLKSYKQRALDKVVNDALIKREAKARGLTVTDEELQEQINTAREQNRLGGSDQVFEDVLKEYWGWSVEDYRRSLRAEMLMQEVAAAVDTEAKQKIDEAFNSLSNGNNFADVVAAYSTEEGTKATGGEFGLVDKSNRNVSPQTIEALFALPAGGVSNPIVIPYGNGYAYEIVKNLEVQGTRVKGAHVIVQIKDINEFLNDTKEKSPVRQYITIK